MFKTLVVKIKDCFNSSSDLSETTQSSAWESLSDSFSDQTFSNHRCDVLSTVLPHTFPVPGCQEIPFSSSLAEEPALIQALNGDYPSPLPMAAGKCEMELRLAEPAVPVLLQDPLMLDGCSRF